MAIVLTENKKIQEATPSSVKYRRPWWQSAGETILYLVIFTALLETYFWMAGIGQQEFLQPDPEFGVKHIPNKLVTWRMEGYSSEKINSDGLRDTEHSFRKLPGVYRIALLGDSATEGLQVSLRDTYGKALERILTSSVGAGSIAATVNNAPSLLINRFEVINFGCSSYSTGQQLEQYRQQVSKYEPDAVVLLYNRGDSFENVIKPGTKASSLEPRPYFYLDDKNALCLDRSILQANQDKLLPHPLLDFLRTHSRIFGVFSQANLSLNLYDSRYRKLLAWFHSWSAAAKKPDFGSGKYTPCVSADHDPIKVTLALVHTLASEAKSHKQRFIFMMFPNTIGDPDVALQQKQLNKLADQDAFDFIDLLPPFQNANPDADFLLIHFSPIGHQRVALMLANLLENKLCTGQ